MNFDITNIITLMLLVMIIIIFYATLSGINIKKISLKSKNKSKQIELFDMITYEKHELITKSNVIDYLKYHSKKYYDKDALKTLITKTEWKIIKYNEYYDNVINFYQSICYWIGEDTKTCIMGCNSLGWIYACLGSMLNNNYSICFSENWNDMKQFMSHIKNHNIELLIIDDDTQLNKLIKLDNLETIKLIVYYSFIKDTKIIDKFDKFGIPVISMGNFLSNKSDINLHPINSTNTAIITHSDFDNKLISITHDEIISHINKFLNVVSYSDINLFEEQFINLIPFNHILTQLLNIYLPIITVSCVSLTNITNKTKPKIIKNLINICEPSVIIASYDLYDKINNIIDKEILSNCKIAFGTGILSNRMKLSKPSKFDIYDIYGITQCPLISISTVKLNKPDSVGLSLVKIKTTNGFIHIYHNDTWINTNDMGHIDSDRYIFINCKKNDVMYINDKMISPINIETKLYELLHEYFQYITLHKIKSKYFAILLFINGKNKDNIDNTEEIENKIKESIEIVNNMIPSDLLLIKKYFIIKSKLRYNYELTYGNRIRRKYVLNKYIK